MLLGHVIVSQEDLFLNMQRTVDDAIIHHVVLAQSADVPDTLAGKLLIISHIQEVIEQVVVALSEDVIGVKHPEVAISRVHQCKHHVLISLRAKHLFGVCKIVRRSYK